jgi:hypothetical protein
MPGAAASSIGTTTSTGTRAVAFTCPQAFTTDAPSHSSDNELSCSLRRTPNSPNASFASLQRLHGCRRPPGSTSLRRWQLRLIDSRGNLFLKG